MGARGSSASDSVSSISESSEDDSGSGPTLERRGLGLGTRARARMHIPGEKSWYLIPCCYCCIQYRYEIKQHTKLCNNEM